jgi:NAD-dependent SIR2 family protein deacetylase
MERIKNCGISIIQGRARRALCALDSLHGSLAGAGSVRENLHSITGTEMLEIDEATDILTQLAINEQLIIFVGSGISIASGLPMWDEFLEKFISFCRDVRRTYEKYPEVQEIFSDALLSDAEIQTKVRPTHVATVLKERMSRLPKRISTNVQNDFRRWFFNLFSHAEPNLQHHWIASTNYPYILTSNYDTLLEDAAKAVGAPYASISFHEKGLVAESLYNQTPAIIHVHGNAYDAVLDQVIFTSEDYIRIIKKGEPGFSFALQSLFLRYSTLFVGYGASDPHLEDLIEEFAYFFDFEESETMSKNYLVVLRDKAQTVYDAYKKRMRTELVVIDDFKQYEHLLKKINIAAPR